MSKKFLSYKLFKLSLVVVSLYIFQSCSSNRFLENDFNKYLTNERFSSQDTSFSVTIPQGWFGTKDNVKKVTDLMLVKNDYSASIFINKINTWQSNYDLEAIGNMSLNFREINNSNSLTNLKLSKGYLGKTPFYRFSYSDKDKNFVTVYEIKKNSNIFEATLIIFKNRKQNQSRLNSLIAVLFSLE